MNSENTLSKCVDCPYARNGNNHSQSLFNSPLTLSDIGGGSTFVVYEVNRAPRLSRDDPCNNCLALKAYQDVVSRSQEMFENELKSIFR